MRFQLARSIDFAVLREQFLSQFRNLDMRNPVAWPVAPRAALFLLVALLVMVLLWLAWLDGVSAELEAERVREVQLRGDYKTKLTKAVNLEPLKKQREQVLHYVNQLEKQLPSKAEMDALLSDINQAGLGRSLQFELFRPGQVVVKDYYAELPIAVRVTGRYHDMGAFASDIAQLSRIVTLNNLAILPGRDGQLGMDVTARTFRYLDPDEVEAQRKAAAAAQRGKK